MKGHILSLLIGISCINTLKDFVAKLDQQRNEELKDLKFERSMLRAEYALKKYYNWRSSQSHTQTHSKP